MESNKIEQQHTSWPDAFIAVAGIGFVTVVTSVVLVIAYLWLR